MAEKYFLIKIIKKLLKNQEKLLKKCFFNLFSPLF